MGARHACRHVRLAHRSGRAYGVLVDLALLEGATIVATSSTDVADAAGIADAARAHGGTAAIVHAGTPVPQGVSLRMVTAPP